MNLTDRMYRNVAIIGGGLAGLAAAQALANKNLQVILFERRRTLGGRAGSFVEQESGDKIDYCQHVAMGCCTNFLNFCKQTEVDHLFRKDEQLQFIGPTGEACRFDAIDWLPAPLHLAFAFLNQIYLSLADRISIGKAVLQLGKATSTDLADRTMAEWLESVKQSPAAIDHFWSIILVSALGDTLDRVSAVAAKKVFVDGFLSHNDASKLHVPHVSFGQIYQRIAENLAANKVVIKTDSAIDLVHQHDSGTFLIQQGSLSHEVDEVIMAVPWNQTEKLLSEEISLQLSGLSNWKSIKHSSISSVHLWFDQPITKLNHAVLVGRLSQWLFQHAGEQDSCHYQVVISASQSIESKSKEEVLADVLAELQQVWPLASKENLLRWKLITQREAVFSMSPTIETLRPQQKTEVPGLYLSGDWTKTGWPSTMEGAVRSGYLAAEALLSHNSAGENLLQADLPMSKLAQWILGSTARSQ